jgi:putative ABC transport system permease protein
MTLVTTLASLQELYATDAVTYVAVYLKDWRQAEGFAAELQARLRAAGVRASVYPFSEEKVNPYYAGTMAFLGSLVTFITLLVTTVVVLGVMNAVTLTVFERTREIGTFRALGYRRRQVAGIFLREILLLASASVGAGIAGALAAAALVNAANIRFSPPGVPGTVQVLLLPSWPIVLAVAALLVPLAALVTYAVARRRAALRTADLLTATTA